MPEVQNVGAVDYSQYQPEMYQAQNTADINGAGMPIAYDDPVYEEKRSAASSMKGLAIAGVIGAVVGGLLTYKFAGGKGSESAIKKIESELNELKNSEAVRNYEKVKEAVLNVEKEAEEAGKKTRWWKPKTWGTKTLTSKIKKIISTAKEGFAKIKDDAGEAAGKVADDAKNAAEDAAKKS